MLAADAGHIKVLDNLSTGTASDLKHLGPEILIGDINDSELMTGAVRGMDTVIHLAAHTRVVESVQDPTGNFAVNAQGTFNCLQASVRGKVDRFIFASTGGAIMGDQKPPVHEEMVPRPLSPYGAGKLAGEAYCSAFWGSYDLRTVILRFSNVYGPYSYGKASVIARFYKQILRDETLLIYGDGTQTRDFLYIDDLCRAVIAACHRELPWGRPFHIASGIETRISELIRMIESVVDHPLKTSFVPQQKGEIHQNYASIEQARQHLDFAAIEPLHTGLKKTWEWFCSNPKSASS
jgi:UDP-glucose 4-epimerase